MKGFLDDVYDDANVSSRASLQPPPVDLPINSMDEYKQLIAATSGGKPLVVFFYSA